MAEELSIDDEHHALMREHAELEKAQHALEARPGDFAAHEVHKKHLREHIERLHAHIRRIRELRAGRGEV